MQPSTKFCTQCGRPLAAGARFCGACGSPVRTPEATTDPAPAQPASAHAQPASAQPAPAAVHRPPFVPQPIPQVSAPNPSAPSPVQQEAIITMIPGVQRTKGILGLGIDAFTLIGTPTRLIFVYLPNKTMNAFVTEARESAKGQGKGWFGQVAAQMGWVNLMLERFQELGPDAVLAQYPGSFFIPNHSVSRVSVKQRASSHDEPPNSIEIILDTSAGKQKFKVPTSMNLSQREIKQRLQQVLGAIVR